MSCVITGTRRAANHAGTSRTTETNVSASPAPTSTRRPASTQPAEGASASTVCPSAIPAAPDATSTRGPYRSSRTPTGTCSSA
nr:hypothetical protein [Cellulomonas sp. Y8]